MTRRRLLLLTPVAAWRVWLLVHRDDRPPQLCGCEPGRYPVAT